MQSELLQSELLRRRTLRVARVCARACVYLCVRACCVCVHMCVRVCVSSLPKEAMAAASLGRRPRWSLSRGAWRERAHFERRKCAATDGGAISMLRGKMDQALASSPVVAWVRSSPASAPSQSRGSPPSGVCVCVSQDSIVVCVSV